MPLHFLLPLAILCAKVCEEIVRRIGMPAILGAILAGIVLGPLGLDVTPSLLSKQETHNQSFAELAQIGLCVLLFRIGTESRFDQLKRVWPQAAVVAISGMVLPLLLGWGVAVFFGFSPIAGLFVGATLTATSIGVTVPVLKELHGLRCTEGLIITGAAVLDDILGLILLSLLLTIAQPGLTSLEGLTETLLLGIGFVVAGVTLGPWLVTHMLTFLRWLNSTQLILVFAFSYLLIMAQLAHDVGLDMIIGAYAAGLAFSAVEERDQVESGLKALTNLFAPLFFVLIGSSLTLPDFSTASPEGWHVILLFLSLCVAAFAGKLLSALLMPGKTVNRWVVGCGMLPRGEVGLVFAQVGLSAGIFTDSIFSLLVLLLVITTYIGPLLLKYLWTAPSRP